MVAELALLIPILALGIGCLGTWTNHKEKLAKIQSKALAEDTAEKAAQYASHVQALEDRVRVLERIVTDRGYDVATQIEALRDQRRVDDGRIQDDGAGMPLPFPRHTERA